MDLGTALVGGVVGLVSGLVSAYATMRFRLREERARWARELSLKYAVARAESISTASTLAEQFGTWLLVIREPGAERQKRFLLPGTRLVVGRSPAADVCINERAASRRHAAFDARETGVFVIDLGTASGTFVNGDRVANSVRLESGDVVSIGDTHITFVAL